MSQFRDTFTKQEKNEPLLDYDDSAFLFFFCAVLCTILLPWTYRVLNRYVLRRTSSLPEKTPQGLTVRYCSCRDCVARVEKARRKEKSLRNLFQKTSLLELVGFSCAVFILWHVASSLKDTKAIQTFDPYEILDIAETSSNREIKKAYRLMSLKYHPDKNTQDPTAAAKFMLVTKAYAALTDEVSKENYAKYGNPDGPGNMKVGIGLPRVLVEERFQLLILCLFFVFLLVIIPMLFLFYYQKQKKYAKNGVQLDTLYFLGHMITENTRFKQLPELMAACAESRDLTMKDTDAEEIKEILKNVVEAKKRTYTLPIIVRNSLLLLAHMQRLHHLLSPKLRTELHKLLKHADIICTTMMEIAFVRCWPLTAKSITEFGRGLVQSLDGRACSLEQIPHFDEEAVRHCQKGKLGSKDLGEFVRRSAEERKGIAHMSSVEVEDVNAFCSHISDMELSVNIFVEDEAHICEGDIATAEVTLARRNLGVSESLGPIHAPHVEGFLYEKWWIIVTDIVTQELLGFQKNSSLEKIMKTRVIFPVMRTGTHDIKIDCWCNSYEGIDLSQTTKFTAVSDKEASRQVYLHPEDEALDKEPTLFQQMMGQLEQNDSSDEEGDEPQAEHQKEE